MNNEATLHTPILSASLFGKFELVNSETGAMLNTDIISSEKITKLLSYFLVHHTHSIPIQELTDIIWADEETSNPVGALKNLVYRMRTLLKKVFGEYEFIQTSRGSYNWNKAIFLSLDFEEYDHCLLHARESSDPSIKIAFLEKAISFYTGDFMSAISGEHWIIPLTTYYRTSYLNTIRELADLYHDQKRYEDIITICNQGLLQDPLDETLHYNVVRAFMDLNDNSKALHHYNKAVASLQQALGINTPSMLKSLHSDLLAMNSLTSAELEDVRDEMIEENPNGAFLCAYGVFCELYRLEARRIQRLGISEYIVLYTLTAGAEKLPDDETQFLLMKKATLRFEQILQNRLRIGDVMTRYSEFQIACLLPTCTYESATRVSERLIDLFMQEFTRKRIQIVYSVDEIDALSKPFLSLKD